VDTGLTCAATGSPAGGGRQSRHNAIKFTPKRQGEYRAVAWRQRDHRARVDYRPGISSRRARPCCGVSTVPTSPKYAGRRPWLNLVAAIVKLHGFRLVIHSGQAAGWRLFVPTSKSEKARPRRGEQNSGASLLLGAEPGFRGCYGRRLGLAIANAHHRSCVAFAASPGASPHTAHSS